MDKRRQLRASVELAGAFGDDDTADDQASQALAFMHLAGECDALAGFDADGRIEAGILRIGLAMTLIIRIAHLVEVDIASADVASILILLLSVWLFAPLLRLLALCHGLLGLQLLGEVLGLPLRLLGFNTRTLQLLLNGLLHLQLRRLLLSKLLGKVL